MDELQSPLSFVRGTDEDRHRFLMEEDAVMTHSFGSDYKSSINTSNFYLARVTPPVPSKRTRHLKIQTKSPINSRYSTDTLTPSPTATRYTSPSHSPCVSSLSPTPTPIIKKKIVPKVKKVTKPTTLTPTQLILAAAKLQKSKVTGKKSTPVKYSPNDDIEPIPVIPLPLSTKLPVYIKMDAKEKEREYWRRQRRVFVNSRFLTNEEGVVVAKTVYSNLSIQADNRMVTSFQGNIGNFRTKLRRTFISQADKFNMTKEYVKDTNDTKMMHDIKSKVILCLFTKSIN